MKSTSEKFVEKTGTVTPQELALFLRDAAIKQREKGNAQNFGNAISSYQSDGTQTSTTVRKPGRERATYASVVKAPEDKAEPIVEHTVSLPSVDPGSGDFTARAAIFETHERDSHQSEPRLVGRTALQEVDLASVEVQPFLDHIGQEQ